MQLEKSRIYIYNNHNYNVRNIDIEKVVINMESNDNIIDNFSDQDSEKLINSVANQFGVDSNELKKALKSGNIQSVIRHLNSENAKNLQNLLSDRGAIKKLMSDPKNQILLKKFLEEI